MSGGKSDYLELKQLDGVLGGTNFTQPATVYLALFTDTNTQAQRDAGTVTEVTGNAYARLSIANNSSNWPAASSGQKQNGAAFTFATPTPLGWGTVTAFGIYDALTTGNLLYWGDLLGTEHPATADTTDLITCPAHGFVQHDKVKFSSVAGISIPAGLTDGAYYYVIATGLTTDAFKVSTTDGGSAVDITASGGGKFGKTQEVTVNANVAPSFATASLTISED
jgi:hypothetical protein